MSLNLIGADIRAYPYAKVYTVGNAHFIPTPPVGKLEQFLKNKNVVKYNELHHIDKLIDAWINPKLYPDETRQVFLFHQQQLLVVSSHYKELTRISNVCHFVVIELTKKIPLMKIITKYRKLILAAAEEEKLVTDIINEIEKAEEPESVLLTQLTGFRIFGVSWLEGRLTAIVQHGIHFKPGWIQAECMSANLYTKNHAATPETTCTCGFYSVRPNDEGFRIAESYMETRSSTMAGLVEMKGRVLIHEYGYRAEYMKISRLFYMSSYLSSSSSQDPYSTTLEALVKYYKVPIHLTTFKEYRNVVNQYLKESYT